MGGYPDDKLAVQVASAPKGAKPQTSWRDLQSIDCAAWIYSFIHSLFLF